MDSILPQISVTIASIVSNQSNTVEIPKEYAWDYKNNAFLLVDGKFKIVEGIEAIKIWIWKALHTIRLKYSIYSEAYGHDIENLVGQGYSRSLLKSELYRMSCECLSVNPHIQKLNNFNVDFSNELATISFDVETDLGTLTVDKVSTSIVA